MNQNSNYSILTKHTQKDIVMKKPPNNSNRANRPSGFYNILKQVGVDII